MKGKIIRHRWPMGPGSIAETCSREGCGVQRRFAKRKKKSWPSSTIYGRLSSTTVEEYSLDGGATWAELSALGGRVPTCRGKGD